ncbi:MAG: pyruvate kinase, partial [Gammaproteobacteria bacterium]
SAPSFTAKDRKDALFALDLGVDFLALSFVRNAGDIQALRDLIRGHGSDAGIIAEIEKPEALEQASVILELSDAIMVARGDLGVERPLRVTTTQQAAVSVVGTLGLTTLSLPSSFKS